MIFHTSKLDSQRLYHAATVSVLALLFLLGGLFILFGRHNRPHVPVLAYHSVNEHIIGVEELTVSDSEFDRQMQYLYENGYTSLTFSEDYSRYKKPVYITFDDGYIDNFQYAYPILKKYHMVATVFLIAGYVNMPGYLSAPQIRQMEDCISFQSHTVDHGRMSHLNARAIARECAESKKIISDLTKEPVYVLAYPNGAFNSVVQKIASSYYSCAVSTLEGYESQIRGNYKIRRISISPDIDIRTFITLLQSNN